jgi:hypothetical protein
VAGVLLLVLLRHEQERSGSGSRRTPETTGVRRRDSRAGQADGAGETSISSTCPVSRQTAE